MAPPYATAQITLKCPLYASDFDPQTNGFLLVGGGGGEGRSGVGNKITLLNAFKKYEISEVVEIGLSRDEDSVTSLAFAQTTELWASAFAGINSSTKDQEAGKNQHLRSFLLEYPPRRKAGASEGDIAPAQEEAPESRGQTKALGKISYFTPDQSSRPETFQRVLRLSKRPQGNGPRLGAVATGLAPIGEIVLFAADTNSPTSKDIRARIRLGKKEEAADIDILAALGEEDDGFLVAYCTDYDIYTAECSYSKGGDRELVPRCIQSNPHPDVFAASKARPKFRSIRFLTPTLLLILQNLPSSAGSELLLMTTQGQLVLRKRLHKKIKSGIALAVASLPYPSSSSANSQKLIQHAIAIAGADTSITILTLDHKPSGPYKNLKFKSHLFLTSVHPTSITSLTFSTPPYKQNPASTSIANTCVVHTLPLSPYPSRKRNEDPIPSYVLRVPKAGRGKATETMFSLFMAVLAIAVASFFLQTFTEIRGGVPEMIGAKKWLSKGLYEQWVLPFEGEGMGRLERNALLGRPEMRRARGEVGISGGEGGGGEGGGEATKLTDLVEKRKAALGQGELHEIVIHQPSGETKGTEDMKVGLHHPNHIIDRHPKAKKWEEMLPSERERWKKRLQEAGHWAADEGETVLKGIFFSGVAGAVGAAVAG
ncbi:uncharacterized protein KY384_003856 [Bacidia gigantensis]|uniref:uncharacterized protein n=1 Tax=Bacidia gigantensis TaxID=2732470 RepID=UPI001D038D07|nr:uncharacterized protein KY384_003856 [Bacidia gigantensis]KAG8532215.1 hypothetical protein KY384_003856 [Bacidia gigantensis]